VSEIIYQFRPYSIYSLASLADNKLWFSELQNLNDPFEGFYRLNIQENESNSPRQSTYDLREFASRESAMDNGALRIKRGAILYMIMKTINSMKAGAKISCFSVPKDNKCPLKNKLMWSHYADGLRGFCMGFDRQQLIDSLNTKEKIVKTIKYTNKPIDINKYKKDGPPSREEALSIIYTKSKEWEYENELRITIQDENNLIGFDPQSLRQVVIGGKVPEDQRKVLVSAIQANYPNVEIMIAQPKHGSFDLTLKPFAL